jgi:KUP system potassium uptake protein
LGKTVYTELRNYIVAELLPDGRSSAIVNPREDPVLNTMARRHGEKDTVDLKLPKNPNETDSSTQPMLQENNTSTENTVQAGLSGASAVDQAKGSDDNKTENRPKQPVVDINERHRRLHAIDEAYKQQVLYVVGKTELNVPEKGFNIFRRFFLGVFLYLRDMTNEKSTSLRIPMDKMVEVGFIREL